MSRPRDIRADLIKPNLEMLQAVGNLRETSAVYPGKRGPAPKVFYLNETQAILVAMWSKTAKARELQLEIASVFKAWRDGRLIPAT